MKFRRTTSMLVSGAVNAALTLVVVLVLGLVTTPLAQAQTFTVLYSFPSYADGSTPNTDLTRDSAGNLYGTAFFGGPGLYSGTVFKVDPSGAKTALNSFAGTSDGATPMAGVIEDAKGQFIWHHFVGRSFR